MPLFASDIRLLEPLKKPLAGINQAAQGRLQKALGGLSDREKTSQIASGRVQGSYIPQELGRAGNEASMGISGGLEGILGEGSLKDYQSEQDYQRNIQLAKILGEAYKPDVFSQVVGGLGGAGVTAFQSKALFDAINNRQRTPRPSLSPNLSLYDPYYSGLEHYYGG